MSAMRYQTELVSGLWDEAMPLLEKHYREIARYKDIALDPDRAVYAAIEAAGKLRCYTGRDGGRLVGYAVFFLMTDPHRRTVLQALQDVLFIEPQSRKGLMAGVRLIRYAEEQLAAEGVQVVYHHVKLINRLGNLLGSIGYEIDGEVYAKRLA